MDFIVNILGSGAALPTGVRRCSAQVVNIRGFKVLVDCAEGTQDRIRAMHIKLQSISTIVISHLHGDHFFGLPGLLSTMHLCGRTEQVVIVAPRGARQAVETLFQITGNHINYPIDWRELDFAEGSRRVFADDHCTIDAFPLVHSVPTFGYRITEVPKGTTRPRTYAYCCDTAYTESIPPHVQGVDMLCLECTFANGMEALAESRQHLTAGQAALLASQSGTRTLLLSHISARYREPDILLQQATEVFQNTVVARDGMRVMLAIKPSQSIIQQPENKHKAQSDEK